MTPKSRFVVLKHYCADGSVHWDLMLEYCDVLRTWRIDTAPKDIKEQICAERIADHKLKFLDYQGGVQNNTGRVESVDNGFFEAIASDDNCYKINFGGKYLNGVFKLEKYSEKNWLLYKLAIPEFVKIGFIGLGIMGKPMAMNLLKAGFSLKVFTRTKHKAQSVIDDGAIWADSPADCASEADFVITCVSDTCDVEKVLLGEDGVIKTVKNGAVCIDMSTISPAATQEMAKSFAVKGVCLIDAPVSGGEIGAIEAKLSVMAGGDEQAFLRAKPIFEILGRNIVYCGQSGYGQMTKLVNQVMVIHTIVSISEGFAFAEKMGLDLNKVYDAVSAGAAGSRSLTVLGKKIIEGDLKPAFMVDLQMKDLRLVMEYAEKIKQPLPATALARELMKQLQAQGRGRDGTQAMVDVIRQLGKK